MAVQVKTTDQLRTQWDSMSDHYAQTSAILTTKIYRSFLPYLRLADAQVVVEAACGPGNGIELLLQSLPATGKVLANDISTKFLDMVRAKGLERVELVEANNETLPYEDGVADRYVANMSLHLVEFPERMAAEAFRLLKSGGIAVFTVWGDREKAPMFDLMMCLQEKYSPEHFRSPFHLSDTAVLKQVLRSVGFTRVLTYEEYGHSPMLDPVVLQNMFLRHPEYALVYQGLDERKKAEFEEDLKAYIHTVLKVKQQPMAMHARIAIAFKP